MNKVVKSLLLGLVASHASILHALSVVDRSLDEIIKYTDLIGIYQNVSISKDELTGEYIYSAKDSLLIIKGIYQNNISICARTDIDFSQVYDKYLLFLHKKTSSISSKQINDDCDFYISTSEQNAYPIDSYNDEDDSGIILISRKSGLNSKISHYDLFIESNDIYIGVDLKDTVSVIQEIHERQMNE